MSNTYEVEEKLALVVPSLANFKIQDTDYTYIKLNIYMKLISPILLYNLCQFTKHILIGNSFRLKSTKINISAKSKGISLYCQKVRYQLLIASHYIQFIANINILLAPRVLRPGLTKLVSILFQYSWKIVCYAILYMNF